MSMAGNLGTFFESGIISDSRSADRKVEPIQAAIMQIYGLTPSVYGLSFCPEGRHVRFREERRDALRRLNEGGEEDEGDTSEVSRMRKDPGL